MNCFLIQQVDNDFISFKVFHFKNYLLLSAYKQNHKLGFYPKEGVQGSLILQTMLFLSIRKEMEEVVFKEKHTLSLTSSAVGCIGV